MANRTFRQTRRNTERIETGVVDLERDEAGITGTVHETDAGNVAENRIDFEPAQEQEIRYADGDGYPIDPNSIADTTEQPRRRRRADAGQRRTRKQRVTFSSQGNLEKLMLSGHMMIAALLKTPELRIDAEESAMLSKATLDVLKAYGVPELTDKQLATYQMVMALGTVYVPRAMIIYSRTHQKPKLVQPIPFPSGAGKAVQEAQPPMQQPQAQQPPQFYGAAPTPPPGQQVVHPETRVNGSEAAYISSAAFAADSSAGLDTINAS